MYKLLIADDEAFERKTIRFFVEKTFKNIEILEDAKTGTEAVSLAKEHKTHIIIMDIKMPEKNGLDAQESIINFLPNVKTIILTAYDNFSFAQNAIKLSAVDYILKPVKPEELNKSITKIISLFKTESTNNINSSVQMSSDKAAVHKAIEYINKNFDKNINLKAVSEYVHLNSHYFSRYFKNNTGLNFTDYVSKVRIKEAKRLLLTTDKSIGRISMDIGYVDPTYFTKVFIKYEGISPHKYRLTKKKFTVELNRI